MAAVDEALAPRPTPAATAAGESCDPRLCTFAGHAHMHCVCGLPMPPGAELCALCLAEGFDPIEAKSQERGDDPLAWDGFSYPSRRRRRIHVGDSEFHLQLIERILQPSGEEEGAGGISRVELRKPPIVKRRSTR